VDIARAKVAAPALGALLARVKDGTITAKSAKDVFAAMWAGEGSADEIIAAKGLERVSDDGALGAAIAAVVDASPSQVAQYRAGDEKVFTWLVGQVMKATRGKAEPARVNELLRAKLSS
jgi:aspartyl-tRNA(Asn)/glutamyl-tRNA(Gln) amidotransferase subunit B